MTNHDVVIEDKGHHVEVATRLPDSGLLVSDIEVTFSGNSYKFEVDSTTKLERQYVFHCIARAE
ncbi:hypothetical protein WLF18_10560 [Pseudomonas shirazensis]|uniref:Uncharacterized protein n=1 Tax=Pseudomonas shirazensis TaxID=2745494 RepID=A0ABU8ZYV8_9PSED